jgi:hypothetical protein
LGADPCPEELLEELKARWWSWLAWLRPGCDLGQHRNRAVLERTVAVAPGDRQRLVGVDRGEVRPLRPAIAGKFKPLRWRRTG